jgi:4'-phosphopantetheinyl transferase
LIRMDIYYYRNKKHDWGQAEECLLPYISEERRKKIAHMRRDSDKELSLYVELLCRYGVVQRLNCKPENIGIGKTNAGKPYVVAAGANPVEISLSHSGEYVVCAVSSTQVGIDVEEMKEPPLEIADIAFGVVEKAYLKEAADKREAFYTLWTRKEALLKKIGCGLVGDVTRLDVMDTNCQDYFYSMEKLNHMITVCGIEEELHFYEVTPSAIRDFFGAL